MVWDIHCVFPWLQGSRHRKLGAGQRSEGIVLRNKEARQTDLSQNQKTRRYYGSGNQIQLSSANSKAESWDFKYQCISGEENRLCLKSHEKENADPTGKVFETIENESNYICYKTPMQLSHKRLWLGTHPDSLPEKGRFSLLEVSTPLDTKDFHRMKIIRCGKVENVMSRGNDSPQERADNGPDTGFSLQEQWNVSTLGERI